MKIFFSKLGLALSGLYAIFSIFIFFEESNCHGSFIDLCGLGLALVSMPFSYVYHLVTGHYFNRGPELTIVFFVGAVINLIILYVIGMDLSKRFSKVNRAKKV